MALDGEVTWKSQIHNLNPPWDLGGATAPTDIDMASTKDLGYIDGLRTGELRKHQVNVTDFVQAWTTGTENNGMVIWDGFVPEAEDCNKHFRLFYHAIVSSEAEVGDEGEQLRM